MKAVKKAEKNPVILKILNPDKKNSIKAIGKTAHKPKRLAQSSRCNFIPGTANKKITKKSRKTEKHNASGAKKLIKKSYFIKKIFTIP